MIYLLSGNHGWEVALLAVPQTRSIDLTADERASDSPYIERVWRSTSDGSRTAFTSIAETHWSLVVTKIQGQTILTVKGPETRPSPAFGPSEAEHFGIMFKHGTLMPLFPAGMVMDRHDINLPDASGQSFWLNGSAWEYPTFENAETFVQRLVRDGLLLHDPVVSAMLEGEPVNTSLRTVQRRFLRATGLTHNTVSQIKRARYATTLLKSGMSILDVVDEAGYADQPHLTRSLKQYIGKTPVQIIAEDEREPLSFLFKTYPF
ncbi:MAG TPA: helix-turn-helix domain-containing protein [Spirillospora sp.]|nr:helix-turn-helix domain-containing protein [Spirillospora sp.]